MNKQSARNILFFWYLLAGKKTDLTKKRVFNSEKAKKRSVEKSTIRNISRNSLHTEMFKFVRFMKITSRKNQLKRLKSCTIRYFQYVLSPLLSYCKKYYAKQKSQFSFDTHSLADSFSS